MQSFGKRSTHLQKKAASSPVRHQVATPAQEQRPDSILRLQQTIGNQAMLRMLQTKPQSSVKDDDKKAELAFGTTMYFSGVPIVTPDQSGPPPSVQPIYPEEGKGFLIAWRVKNIGWKTAPSHHNSLTIYDAHFCAGCRRPEDEVYHRETLAFSVVSEKQAGKSEYEESFWVDGLPAGHYEAFGEVDVQNEVEEINEDNNTQFTIFDVKPGNKPTSTPEA